MARKLERGSESGQPSTGRDDSINGRKSGAGDGLFGRRNYLKLGGAAIAALAGFTMGTTPALANDDEYEVIELDPGEQRAHDLEDGEAFENVLIDQTAEGAMFALRVDEDADDWAIRNVGWKGVAPSGGARDYTFLMHVRGSGVIENIFIDQRNHDGGQGSDVGGIWTYSDSHHGHIECRHNFIAGCGNNASYSSGDGWGHYDATGTIEHYRSYHRDNTVSNYRPGLPECYVRECVSVINDPEGTRGGYPSTGSQMSRAVWAWHHPEIVMEDSAIWHDPDDVQPAIPFWATLRDGSGGSQCELHVVDCDINESWTEAGNQVRRSGDDTERRRVNFDELGTEPDVSILGEGVPTTPEMAAAGERNLPPELGTAPSGGVGEFDGAEDEDDDDGGNASVDANETAHGQSGGSQAHIYEGNSGTTTTESTQTTEDTDSDPGMLLGSGVGSIGVAGYILRDNFSWNV